MTQVKSKRMVALGFAFLVLAAGIAGASGLVAADHSTDGESWVDNSVSGDAPPMTIETMRAVMGGMSDRASHKFASMFGDDAMNASQSADALRDEYNSNSGTYESWAAEHQDASQNHTVLAVEQSVDGETVTSYVVADVTTDSDGAYVYENTSMKASLPDGESVDETVSLEGAAARNAADELAALRESHISQGDALSRDDPAVIRLVTTYASDFDTTINGGSL